MGRGVELLASCYGQHVAHALPAVPRERRLIPTTRDSPLRSVDFDSLLLTVTRAVDPKYPFNFGALVDPANVGLGGWLTIKDLATLGCNRVLREQVREAITVMLLLATPRLAFPAVVALSLSDGGTACRDLLFLAARGDMSKVPTEVRRRAWNDAPQEARLEAARALDLATLRQGKPRRAARFTLRKSVGPARPAPRKEAATAATNPFAAPPQKDAFCPSGTSRRRCAGAGQLKRWSNNLTWHPVVELLNRPPEVVLGRRVSGQ